MDNDWADESWDKLERFIWLFGDWIQKQPEEVALSSALTFGAEFEQVQQLIEEHIESTPIVYL